MKLASMPFAPTSSAVRPNPSCLLTELGDGTGVLLDLTTKFYFTLNDTGVFVWKTLLRQESASPESLADALVAEFEVDLSVARDDVSSLVDELVREGLCTRI